MVCASLCCVAVVVRMPMLADLTLLHRVESPFEAMLQLRLHALLLNFRPRSRKKVYITMTGIAMTGMWYVPGGRGAAV